MSLYLASHYLERQYSTASTLLWDSELIRLVLSLTANRDIESIRVALAMTENSSKGKCAVCGVEASQFCSACKTVRYCGAEHQKNHWKVHKLECRPYTIGIADDVGRYLYATRDIKAKTVIFTETPLVVGPKWYLSEQEESSPIVPCVGCFTPTRIGSNICPRCRWPVCAEACAGIDNPKLHALECPILMLGRGPKKPNDLRALLDYYRTDALVVLKCLMLQRKFPKKWLELMDMQSHEIERLGSELYQDAEKRIVSYLMQNFIGPLTSLEKQTNNNVLSKSDVETLHKICGIIETNYMCINLLNGLELSGIFYTACMMEHSCLPNSYFTFDHNNGFKISVIAGRDIKKGEHLKIMYSNMLWGSHLRQEHLQMTKHFLCRCDRCTDPTELGTYLSGLMCMGPELDPCGGVQLPQYPLDPKTEWICNKCPVRVSSEEIRYLMSQMSEEVDVLLSKKSTVNQLEELIEKLSKFLHANHYHLFNLKHSLIQLYGTQTGYHLDQLTAAQLQKKLQMCDDLLSICDKLDPYTIRLSLYVGIILYEKNSVLVETSKRTFSNQNGSTDNESDLALDNFKMARDCLLRAAEVLKKELDTVGGAKLSDAVIKAISNLDSLISNNPP